MSTFISGDRNVNSKVLKDLYYAKKDYAQCLKFAKKCIKSDPHFWYYYLMHGFSLREFEKRDAALKQFKIGWNMDPSNDLMRFIYGNQLFMLKHIEESAKIHREFFDDKYQLKLSKSDAIATDICVQFGESFIDKIYKLYSMNTQKIISYDRKIRKSSLKTYNMNCKRKNKRRNKYSKIAKIILKQGFQSIPPEKYAFDFCYVTRRLISVDIIDMKWNDAFNKCLDIIRFPQQRIPEDYKLFHQISFTLRKYEMTEQFLIQWMNKSYAKWCNDSDLQWYIKDCIDTDDNTLLTIYCHLILLYCHNGQFNESKCKSLIEKGKHLCLKLYDIVKENYVHSPVFHFHFIYAYYLGMNNNIDPETASDAFCICWMQNMEELNAGNLFLKMNYYFAKYLHYKQGNLILAQFFYFNYILKMQFDAIEMVYYDYAKLLYETKKYKSSLKYWKKAKNILLCTDNKTEYIEFKNLLISKQIEKQDCIYCSWCNSKQTEFIVFKKCARCRVNFYCSKLCQKKDWNKSHRIKCNEAIILNQCLWKWIGIKLDRLCICNPKRSDHLKYIKWMIFRKEFHCVFKYTKHGLFDKDLINMNMHSCFKK